MHCILQYRHVELWGEMAKEITQIIERLQAASDGKKCNVTFRLGEDNVKRFKVACKKNGVAASSVIDELIKWFLSESSRK